ncbi:MAG: DUF6291 domain-containing protein [Clostridia bacterium]|nr:DUF6291 domain-containing protein [Clostridia bacterium]
MTFKRATQRDPKKKSFMMYLDKFDMLQRLSREQRGDLIYAIYQYERGEETINLDSITEIAFCAFRDALEINSRRYNEICERNAIRKERANQSEEEKRLKKEKDTETDTDTDTETDTETGARARARVCACAREEEGNAAFNRFWAKYPKKKNRSDAAKAWEGANIDNETANKIFKTLEWQIKSVEWTKENGRYIPLPAKWIKDGRWEDEPFPEDECVHDDFYKLVVQRDEASTDEMTDSGRLDDERDFFNGVTMSENSEKIEYMQQIEQGNKLETRRRDVLKQLNE